MESNPNHDLIRVFRELETELRAILRRKGLSHHEEEEILSKLAQTAVQASQGLVPITDPRRYFMKALSNQVQQRHRERPMDHSQDLDQMPHGGQDPFQLASAADLLGWLEDRVLALPSPENQILHMQLYEDMTPSEVAGRLGMKSGTVRSHASRARQRLRSDLDDRGINLGACAIALPGLLDSDWVGTQPALEPTPESLAGVQGSLWGKALLYLSVVAAAGLLVLVASKSLSGSGRDSHAAQGPEDQVAQVGDPAEALSRPRDEAALPVGQPDKGGPTRSAVAAEPAMQVYLGDGASATRRPLARGGVVVEAKRVDSDDGPPVETTTDDEGRAEFTLSELGGDGSFEIRVKPGQPGLIPLSFHESVRWSSGGELPRPIWLSAWEADILLELVLEASQSGWSVVSEGVEYRSEGLRCGVPWSSRAPEVQMMVRVPGGLSRRIPIPGDLGLEPSVVRIPEVMEKGVKLHITGPSGEAIHGATVRVPSQEIVVENFTSGGELRLAAVPSMILGSTVHPRFAPKTWRFTKEMIDRGVATIVLEPQRSFAIRVLGPSKSPLLGASLTLVGEGGSTVIDQLFTGADGTFAGSVSPKAGKVIAQFSGLAAQQVAITPKEELLVTLGPGSSFTGVVDLGTPGPKATVFVRLDGVTLELRTLTDEYGRYSFEDLPVAGRVTFWVTCDGFEAKEVPLSEAHSISLERRIQAALDVGLVGQPGVEPVYSYWIYPSDGGGRCLGYQEQTQGQVSLDHHFLADRRFLIVVAADGAVAKSVLHTFGTDPSDPPLRIELEPFVPVEVQWTESLRESMVASAEIVPLDPAELDRLGLLGPRYRLHGLAGGLELRSRPAGPFQLRLQLVEGGTVLVPFEEGSGFTGLQQVELVSVLIPKQACEEHADCTLSRRLTPIDQESLVLVETGVERDTHVWLAPGVLRSWIIHSVQPGQPESQSITIPSQASEFRLPLPGK